MKNVWAEFKSFALSGNMFDLALGFIIGAAFSALVESLASDVIMQLVAAIFGKPDFSDLTITLNGSEIRYGAFLTGLLNFLLLAFVLFMLVKLLKRAGLGKFDAQGSRECPWCKEFIAVDALRCKECSADIDPLVVDEEAEQLLAARRAASEASGTA